MLSISLEIERSLTINKPISEVFRAAADFSAWTKWSPWYCQDRTSKITLKGAAGSIGQSYEWESDFIGTGKMTLVDTVANKSLGIDLCFFKPWKSQSRVEFFFSEQEGGTHVTWKMKGSLPFFMFFFKKMMMAFMGGDFERGLAMLKDFVESGTVHNLIDFNGVVECDGFLYVGKRNQCSMNEIGAKMHQDFAEIHALVEKGVLAKPQLALAFYPKYDVVSGLCEYLACVGYKSSSQSKPTPVGYETGSVAPHSSVQVDHHGPYRHIGAAWSAAMGRQRNSKKKSLKGVAPYEIYRIMPGAGPESEIFTQIYIPVR